MNAETQAIGALMGLLLALFTVFGVITSSISGDPKDTTDLISCGLALAFIVVPLGFIIGVVFGR